MHRTGDCCSKILNQSLCFLLSQGRQHIKADHLKLEPLFPVAVAGEDVLRSGLPVEELLAAAAPITAKPSKLTHSGSEGRGERLHGAPSSFGLPYQA